jgi:hypothetical protein
MVSMKEGMQVLRAEFLFGSGPDPAALMDGLLESFSRSGMSFQYFKGNDSLLHYTLVDWSSGVRRMVDILNQVRAMWSRRRHPGEWLYASFLADFALEGYLGGEPGRSMDEADRLEFRELGVRLVYNGRAFLGRETFSVVATCRATGVLEDGDRAEHEGNARMLLDALVDAWSRTGPLFGWVGVGSRPYVEVPQLSGPAMIPRQAWLVFYGAEDAARLLDAGDGALEGLASRRLDGGGLVVENVRRAPEEISCLGGAGR